MTASIHDVLVDLRQSSLDTRDQGDKFERLVLHLLRTDPEWVQRFSDVWLWQDWPGRDSRTDTGVDIVAKLRDQDGLAAIQCKFYGPGSRVSKHDVDTFLSASGSEEFLARYIFDTADAWGGNAVDTATNQTVPVQRIDIAYLGQSRIDWGQFSWTTPEVLVPTGRKHLLPHQQCAVDEVRTRLRQHDRGKLIMACGTGKTFTSLKLTEDVVGEGGTALVLVPSIQLLSQSLREWMQETEVGIRPFAVCSDVRVGRKTQSSDDGEISVIDLSEPATTDAATLVQRFAPETTEQSRMNVVFATYQSIDVVAEAQRQGLPEFDLIVCDEAHRTTGVTLAEQDESHFVKVHDNDFLQGKKRLYMTATPKVFGDQAKKKAADADAVLADMSQEELFGPELHRLGFGEAVEADLLTDYKVLVLAVEEEYISEHFQQTMAESGELQLGEAAKLIGCWSGLAKRFGEASERNADPRPMRRAVAFAKDIKASQQAAGSFPALVDRAIETSHADELRGEDRRATRVEAAHVDGSMGVQQRNRLLNWLKDDPDDDTCRVLTNARCLSEGVDVPALDAVLFLTPRASQIDIVQAVGRVMRKAPGKTQGYVILPVAVPAGVTAHDALDDNARYRVVWQVLQALRSHDERFEAMVNQIELNHQPSERALIDNGTPRPEESGDAESADGASAHEATRQLTLPLNLAEFREAVYARIVKKVGERKYWEKWAADIADIAQAHITRINGLLADPDSAPAQEFDKFLEGLRGNLNEQISREDAVEMLAQHLITAPVFDALFAGYSFAEHNPVAQTMERMLAVLDEHNLGAEQQTLDRFYDSVRRRVAGVDNAEGKQRVIVELYENFFATAFKKTVDRLGIVYTPVEIVDFILKSADEVLRSEFGRGLTDEGVHILDGFVGTGTFLVRLLQSGLITRHDLARKYAEELHGNEILLLAYYIAAVNIETAYADIVRRNGNEAEVTDGDGSRNDYEPFPGLVLTDTFQSYEDGDRDDLAIFPANNERIERQRQLPITVIVGNPPYSSGQDSANDDAANLKYPGIDAAIRETYAAGTTAQNKNSLYDSYIRAIKWASLRVGEQGVIAYVTNGGWLEGNAHAGTRKSLAEEFSSIHVYNLRGNQRTAGEQSQREGGKIFGGGSRATVAVVVLVKKPQQAGRAQIHYTDIGDYLSREDKLARVASAGSFAGLEVVSISPNGHGDWLHQRRDDFEAFIPLATQGNSESIFVYYGPGLQTNRDAWVYNASAAGLYANMSVATNTYSRALNGERTNDRAHIKWSSSLEQRLARGERLPLSSGPPRVASYRPFCTVLAYDDVRWIHRPGIMFRTFPTSAHDNLGFYALNPGAAKPFSALMVAVLPDLAFYGSNAGQYFARWSWEPVEEEGTLDLGFTQEPGVAPGAPGEVLDGYRRVDNITDAALARWQAAYPAPDGGGTGEGGAWTKDDVFYYCYGLLHSPDYRETYAANLKKVLPRIPLVATAKDAAAFAEAGRRLAELHVGYEHVEPYALDGLHPEGAPAVDDRSEAVYRFYAVTDKRMKFGKATAEQKAAGEKHDRSIIHYNANITVSGIPADAYRYQLGSRSAIEWIIDRYHIKTDKASGIVNDPNDWSREVGDPRYILELLARVVTVSVETMKIVDDLPPLVVHEQQ